MSVFGSDYDLVVRVAVWSTLAALLTSVLLISWIVILRVRLTVRERRQDDLVAGWRPVLAEAALGRLSASAPLPAVDHGNLVLFLRECNALQDTLAAGAAGNLNMLLERLSLVGHVRRMLYDKRVSTRALATRALGHLRDAQSWPELAKQLDSHNHVLSLLAARALVQIDAEQALPAILVRISERHDWSPGRVAALLVEAGAGVVTKPLCAEIVRGPAQRTVRLLRFIPVAHSSATFDTLARLLRAGDDEGVICECLRVTAHAALRPLIYRYLFHRQWFVRLHAVEALGRVCEPDDVRMMTALLADEQWWVRYRTAQALVRVPWFSADDLKRIRAGQADRFGREILDQALAELRFQ